MVYSNLKSKKFFTCYTEFQIFTGSKIRPRLYPNPQNEVSVPDPDLDIFRRIRIRCFWSEHLDFDNFKLQIRIQTSSILNLNSMRIRNNATVFYFSKYCNTKTLAPPRPVSYI